MMTTHPATSSAEIPTTATLENFFEQLLHTNPFVLNRVLQPTTLEADARVIHQTPFRQLVALAETARTQRLGIGVMLQGEAGVGKSHLLARLAGWAGERNQALFVYFHNLQARAETLPRYLVKCVVSALTAGRGSSYYDTALFRLVHTAVKMALDHRAGRPLTWPDLESAYQRWLDHLLAGDPARAASIDRPTFGVLLQFFRSAYLTHRLGKDDTVARLAVLWLSGEPLDSQDARLLGLPLNPGGPNVTALRDDQQIKQVMLALAQMAWLCRQPLLLCFDQVDNLEKEQVAVLARFLQGLLDCTPNLLVVTSGVQATLRRFHDDQTIQQSSWDRLAQFEVHLQRISAREAGWIVQTRLERFIEPFLEIEPVKNLVREDHLFPLGKIWFEEVFQKKNDIRPRDAITWAREGWQRQQTALRNLGGPTWLSTWGRMVPPLYSDEPLTDEELIDRKVDQKIAEEQRRVEAEPENLPPDADQLAGLVQGLLNQCVGAGPDHPILEVKLLRHGPRPYQLLVRQRREPEDQEGTTGLLFVVTQNANSAAAQLRRTLQDPHPPQRVLLVTDERWPIPLGAQGEIYLEQLRGRKGVHFQRIDLSFVQYAGLQALQDVVAMAWSGDLEIETPPGPNRLISEDEVMASHHRKQRYRTYPPLRELFLFEAPPRAEGRQTSGTGRSSEPALVLDETDGRSFLLAQLALSSGESSMGLAVKYAAYLRRIKGVQVEGPRCQPEVETLARKMHQEGLLQMSALDEGLFLSLK